MTRSNDEEQGGDSASETSLRLMAVQRTAPPVGVMASSSVDDDEKKEQTTMLPLPPWQGPSLYQSNRQLFDNYAAKDANERRFQAARRIRDQQLEEVLASWERRWKCRREILFAIGSLGWLLVSVGLGMVWASKVQNLNRIISLVLVLGLGAVVLVKVNSHRQKMKQRHSGDIYVRNN